MLNPQENAPKAGATAKGAYVGSVHSNQHNDTYQAPQGRSKRLVVRAIGPDGPFTVKGQTAKSLLALVTAGAKGVTALEAASWALRLAAYCHDLRTKHRLAIETVREDHEGGWHGRHVLRSPVQILESGQ